MILDAKSTPIVTSLSALNLSFMKRETRFDLPAPEGPSITTAPTTHQRKIQRRGQHVVTKHTESY